MPSVSVLAPDSAVMLSPWSDLSQVDTTVKAFCSCSALIAKTLLKCGLILAQSCLSRLFLLVVVTYGESANIHTNY